MNSKRGSGDETWHRLLQWTKEQAPSERLAGHVLRLEGYESIDPSHPLGGKDGIKDLIALRDGYRWAVGSYFPRGQQSPGSIKKKFSEDFAGVVANNTQAFAFVTNQELRLAEREELSCSAGNIPVEIYHLERMAQILDSAPAYGVRLEFLDIQMSKEDQVSFFAWIESRNKEDLTVAFQEQNRYLTNLLTGGESVPYVRYSLFDKPKEDHRETTVASIGVLGDSPLFDVCAIGISFINFERSHAGSGGKLATLPALYPTGHVPLIFDEDNDKWEFKGNIDDRTLQAEFLCRNGRFIQRTTLKLTDNTNKKLIRHPDRDTIYLIKDENITGKTHLFVENLASVSGVIKIRERSFGVDVNGRLYIYDETCFGFDGEMKSHVPGIVDRHKYVLRKPSTGEEK